LKHLPGMINLKLSIDDVKAVFFHLRVFDWCENPEKY
jgi:hypothetical protein